jgi:diguanylate cyclase
MHEPLIKNTASNSRTFDHTIHYARTAMERICTLRTPADPQTYHLWYAYAASHNPQLNAFLNGALERHGSISLDDLDQAQEHYLSSFNALEQVNAVTPEINHELSLLLKMVDSAIGNSDKYQAHLVRTANSLNDSEDRTSLLSAIQRIAVATSEMERQNAELRASLTNASDQIGKLSKDLETVRIESLQDPLTQLANRRLFDESIARSVEASLGKSSPLSLLMCDIDHFKSFNDRFGHKVGDSVLRLVSHMIKQSIRGRDIAARYGGEEFGIILPDTSLGQAEVVAENIRKAVSEKQAIRRSTQESLGHITVSIGAAQLLTHESFGQLVERADKCLYQAKHQGRNRVVTASKFAIKNANPKYLSL